jgi:hypothetical protein
MYLNLKRENMKKTPKVEYGIQIVKPWSREMYDHNDGVAEVVKAKIHTMWVAAYESAEKELEAEEEDYVGFPDMQWEDMASEDMKRIQTAVTCYGFGFGYSVEDVSLRVEEELDIAAFFRLKEIAEELDIELEKGFVGFS